MADLADLLAGHRALVVAMVRRHATSVLAYEAVEDLAQGVIVRAIEQRSRYVHRSEPEFRAWLERVVRGHLADRHDYWSALKRRSGRVLRYTFSRGGDGVSLPAGTRTGPGTFAERRELLALAARALAALPERDRELVQMASERVPLAEQATRLGLGYAATQKAGLRAHERFRKAFELLQRGRTGS